MTNTELKKGYLYKNFIKGKFTRDKIYMYFQSVKQGMCFFRSLKIRVRCEKDRILITDCVLSRVIKI